MNRVDEFPVRVVEEQPIRVRFMSYVLFCPFGRAA